MKNDAGIGPINSFLSNRRCIDRLIKEYNEHHNLIIGYDFDCTIYDFHNEGLYLKPIIDLLRKCTKLGFTMCLYTVNINPNDVIHKTAYCIENEIGVDHVNDSPVLSNNHKPYFNILLDDRAGLHSAYYILTMTLKELNL